MHCKCASVTCICVYPHTCTSIKDSLKADSMCIHAVCMSACVCVCMCVYMFECVRTCPHIQILTPRYNYHNMLYHLLTVETTNSTSNLSSSLLVLFCLLIRCLVFKCRGYKEAFQMRRQCNDVNKTPFPTCFQFFYTGWSVSYDTSNAG